MENGKVINLFANESVWESFHVVCLSLSLALIGKKVSFGVDKMIQILNLNWTQSFVAEMKVSKSNQRSFSQTNCYQAVEKIEKSRVDFATNDNMNSFLYLMHKSCRSHYFPSRDMKWEKRSFSSRQIWNAGEMSARRNAIRFDVWFENWPFYGLNKLGNSFLMRNFNVVINC